MAKKYAKVIEHLAGLLKDVATAEFGVFGYGAIEKMVHGTALTTSDVGFAILGAVLYVALNAAALWLLKDD
ncbi:hypothetical protein [Ralstonia pseudosolanacearum]|uniref:hypothetical protein n=1 Tax=Ralstonia pseudosolanacearum TaxID=1310165 RepID=UPI003CE78663